MDKDELLLCLSNVKRDVGSIKTSCANIEKRVDSIVGTLQETDVRLRSLENSRSRLWGAYTTLTAGIAAFGGWIGLK